MDAEVHIVELHVVLVVARRQQRACARLSYLRVQSEYLLRNAQRHHVVLLKELKNCILSGLSYRKSHLRRDLAEKVHMHLLHDVLVHDVAGILAELVEALAF